MSLSAMVKLDSSSEVIAGSVYSEEIQEIIQMACLGRKRALQASQTVCNRLRVLCLNKQYSSIHEPDYIKYEPDIPEYKCLNIKIMGYSYAVLESYAKYVHNMADTLGLDTNVWPTPARTTRVVTYKPFSTKTEDTFDLAKYERTVQVENLPSTVAPILLQVIQQSLPQGVDFTIKQPDEEEEEFRYVPDLILLELKAQVEDIDQAKEDRKKK